MWCSFVYIIANVTDLHNGYSLTYENKRSMGGSMHLFCMYVMMYVQIWNSTWSIANIQHLTSAKEFEASIPVKYFKTILYKDSCPKEMTVEICKVVPLKKFSSQSSAGYKTLLHTNRG